MTYSCKTSLPQFQLILKSDTGILKRMPARQKKPAGPGKLLRVAPGLCRYSSSGVYFAHVRIGGKLFRDSLETTDRKLADRKLADFRRDKLKIDPKAGKLTIEELADRYEKTISHLAESTVSAKSGILTRLKSEWPEGKGQGVAEVKPSDCDRWLAAQAKRVGRSHYNAYVQLLKDLFEVAVRDRLISENPAAHLKYVKRDKPIRRTPTFEEFRAIVADIRAQQFNADAEESGDFVEFIGLAGLGQAEAAALEIGDIDFDRQQITTFRQKTRQGFTIPIYPQLRPLLERLVAKAKQEGRVRLFPIAQARKAIAGACRRLGLPAYSHRSFRRLFVTRALERGVDVKVIAQWQGHRDGGQLVLTTYAHVSPVHSRRMAELMAE
jgi:integrase